MGGFRSFCLLRRDLGGKIFEEARLLLSVMHLDPV